MSIRRRAAGAATALLLLAGCAESTGPDVLFSLRNDTGMVLAWVAVPAVQGAVIDPAPFLAPGTYEDRTILPGRTAPVPAVAGLDPGGDVLVFLYDVQADGSGAFYTTARLVTAIEMVRHGGIIRLDFELLTSR